MAQRGDAIMGLLMVYNGFNSKGESKYRDDASPKTVSEYIKDILKTKGLIGSWAITNIEKAADEMTALSEALHKLGGVHLRHFVITLDTDISPETLFSLAKSFAFYYGAMHQIIFGIHQDTDHSHIHFMMNSVSYRTGRKYYGTYGQFFGFVRYCNDVLREWGIDEEIKYQPK